MEPLFPRRNASGQRRASVTKTYSKQWTEGISQPLMAGNATPVQYQPRAKIGSFLPLQFHYRFFSPYSQFFLLDKLKLCELR
jgi:hypothetical protein